MRVLGTRGNWVSFEREKSKTENISVSFWINPQIHGFPTYWACAWHGLFAAKSFGTEGSEWREKELKF